MRISDWSSDVCSSDLQEHMTHQFDSSMLREYDIRGIVGETLGADDARAIGRSFATMLRRAGGRTVAVGYDGRTSSTMLEAALVAGLMASGCDVVRVGMRSEEHTSELQSLMRISYAVFCLNKQY